MRQQLSNQRINGACRLGTDDDLACEVLGTVIRLCDKEAPRCARARCTAQETQCPDCFRRALHGSAVSVEAAIAPSGCCCVSSQSVLANAGKAHANSQHTARNAGHFLTKRMISPTAAQPLAARLRLNAALSQTEISHPLWHALGGRFCETVPGPREACSISKLSLSVVVYSHDATEHARCQCVPKQRSRRSTGSSIDVDRDK